MKRLLILLLLTGAALGVVTFVFRNALLGAAMEQAVWRLTGFRADVAKLNYTLPSTIEIQGLTIANPEGFRERILTRIPEIYVSLDLPALLKKERIHLPEVRLNLEEVHIEKNAEGMTNVALLSSVGGAADKGAKPRAKPVSGAKPAMPFRLDRFELTLREVSFRDHSSLAPGSSKLKVARNVVGGKLRPRKISVDLNVRKEVFTDIEDPKVLVNLVVLKIVYGTTFGKLMGLNPEKLFKETFQGSLASGERLAEQAAGWMTQAAGEMAVEARELVEGGLETVAGKTAGAVGDSPKGATGSLAEKASDARERVTGFLGKLKSKLPVEEKPQD